MNITLIHNYSLRNKINFSLEFRPSKQKRSSIFYFFFFFRRLIEYNELHIGLKEIKCIKNFI